MTNNMRTGNDVRHEDSEPVSTTGSAERPASDGGARFAMVVLYVADLERSVDFYRLLGLTVPDPHPGSPLVVYDEGGVRRMIIATGDVARRFDPAWEVAPAGGYRQVVEFFVDDDGAVDRAWRSLTGAGHPGIGAPGRPNGAYTALVRDPDDNVVMVTHEP